MANYLVRVDIDQQALEDAIANGEGLPDLLKAEVDKIASRANSLGGVFFAVQLRTEALQLSPQGRAANLTQAVLL